MERIIVLGAGGQLGQCIKKAVTQQAPGEFVFPAEGEADILDQQALDRLFETQRPAWVINCAAYTAVDKAESDPETADRVNHVGVENIARCCAKVSAGLIHISTDFVFEGRQVKLLGEEDSPNPVNVYGATKLAGEQVIANHIDKFFIVRTSWLYSEFGNNFVKTMLRLGAERDSLTVIADQLGTPTYAPDLVNGIFAILRSASDEYGIYHYSNEGSASWFDFAKAVFEISGIAMALSPIPTEAYPTPAKRPAFSVMDKTKIKKAFGIDIPYWRTSLEKCIANLT